MTPSRSFTIAALALTCGLMACGGQEGFAPGTAGKDDSAKAGATAKTGEGSKPGGVAIPIAPQPTADKLAAALAKVIAHRRTIEAPFVEQFEESFKERVKKSKKARKLLTAVYEKNDWMFVFADGASLKPGAKELQRLVAELPSHGIDLAAYPKAELDALIEEYEQASVGYLELKKRELTGAAGKLRTLVETVRGTPTAAELAPGLLEADLSDDDASAVAEVAELQDQLFESKRALNDVLQRLDIRLLESYFRYALDFKHVKVAHPWRAMRNPDSAWQHFHKKLLADLEEGKDSVEETLRSYWPNNPLYEKTRVGLAFYEKLVEDKRFVELPTRTYKRGQKGEAITLLQRRLMVEGYYGGELTGVFDEAVDKAVRAYQTSHQLDVDGVVANVTLRSMNKPFGSRVDDIKLSLQRWRESDTRGEDRFYIRVNIPQFQAEMWEDGKLLRKYNVVVGSNAWEEDPDRGLQGHLNRTMLFSAEMETIVVNPRWNVPSRIKQTELDKGAAEDPEYWAKHHYVVETQEDGTEVVYQESGRWNALGLVKFLFPNDYSIYLHDTNLKYLFANTIRAYSHGCMRVENALDMAEFLFQKDGRLSPEELKAVLRTRTERGFSLRKKIPVHVEYNTVSVDEAGHVMFFLDVYKYDQAFRDGKVPLSGAKPIAREG